MLSIDSTQRWFAVLEDCDWGINDIIHYDAIYKDFKAPYGDRRQDIVFIGSHLNRDMIESTLNECLMSEAEFIQYMNDSVPSMVQTIGTAKENKNNSKPSKKRSKIAPLMKEFHAIIPINGEYMFNVPVNSCVDLTHAKLVTNGTTSTLPPIGVFLNSIDQEEEEGEDSGKVCYIC